MEHRPIVLFLTAAALLLGGAAFAADTKPAAQPAATQPAKPPSKTSPPAKKPKLVEINSASLAQLKTVPGIGDAEAQSIIKNRPYNTRSHMVTKGALSYGTYLAVKDYLQVVPPDPKKGKK